MKKSELRERIKRDLGFPIVKIELTDEQIEDSIGDGIIKFKTYASGNATEECFFTVRLSGGCTEYEMPDGIIDVIDYTEATRGKYNQLFTVENQMFNSMINQNIWGDFNLVTYHLALNFIETFNRYTTNKFHYKYIKKLNKLEITPVPDKLQFVMVKAISYANALAGDWTLEGYLEELYDVDWIRMYALALTKVKLGLVRRKFNSFQSIGNTGIDLDGDSLISEGNEEREDLLQRLTDEYSWDYVSEIIVG